MVAYNFQHRFASAVGRGEKCQTIRAARRGRARHARVGEAVQLYSSRFVKPVRKLVDPDPVCTLVEPVRFDPVGVTLRVGGIAFVPAAREMFARQDGFEGIEDMAAWWRETHGLGVFEGVLIRWAA